MKTQFSLSRTFTPLHAHVQLGPLPSQVHLPVGPTPTRQSRQQLPGSETGGIAEPGHLPSDSPKPSSSGVPVRGRGAKNPEPDVRAPVSGRRTERCTESARTAADRLRLPWQRGGTRGCSGPAFQVRRGRGGDAAGRQGASGAGDARSCGPLGRFSRASSLFLEKPETSKSCQTPRTPLRPPCRAVGARAVPGPRSPVRRARRARV